MGKVYDNRKWKQLGFKEKSQYVMAIGFGVASIVLGFVSFIVLSFIPTSVIAMSGLWASVACGIFGISMYFKTEMMELNEKIDKKIDSIGKDTDKE